MYGSFPISFKPNDLTFSWIVKALGKTPETAQQLLEHCHISYFEQLNTLGNIILGGVTGQTLASIIKTTKKMETLLVSWHWVEHCDGETEFQEDKHLFDHII